MNDACNAIKKLTDQAVLQDIAKNAIPTDLRKAAMEKLDDQSVLGDLVKYDKDHHIRYCALEAISDQAVLAAVASELVFMSGSNNEALYKNAIRRVADASVRAEIEKNTYKNRFEHYMSLYGKIENITDQAALIDIAKNHNFGFYDRGTNTNFSYFSIRKKAAKRITDKELSKKIRDDIKAAVEYANSFPTND